MPSDHVHQQPTGDALHHSLDPVFRAISTSLPSLDVIDPTAGAYVDQGTVKGDTFAGLDYLAITADVASTGVL